MANILQENIAVTDYVIPLTFYAADIPNAAGTAIASLGGNEYVLPFAGSIVGISAAINADLTTGTVTFRPTINGTASTVVTTAVTNGTQYSSAKKDTNVVPFAAGARLGVDFTKSGTVNPTTADGVIVLYVHIAGVSL